MRASGDSPRAAVGGALFGIAALAALLVFQDWRDGWPFSRHHEHTVVAGDAMQAGSGSVATAARVAVALDATQFERLGVQLEPARLEAITAVARHVATVTADESRISRVHPRVSGWVERLYVSTTGESVRAGQPLAAVFSQDLFASQTEYLAVLRQPEPTRSSVLLEAARTRLSVLGMTAAEIDAVEREGAARRLVTIVAPRSGVVLHRGVTVGTAVDPSTELVTIADLSSVWVVAEVAEGSSVAVTPGTQAVLDFPASGRRVFSAAVDFVYPTLSERTRTVRARFSVENPDGVLRPGLYGSATFGAPEREAVTIARDALIETGESQHVFVQTELGVLEPRVVRPGVRAGDRVEVLEGLAAGEQVVRAGAFLIDSESRLRASGTGIGHAGHGGAPSPAPANSEPAPTEHAGHGAH